MAPPADQGPGDGENNFWIQCTNGLSDPEDDIAMSINPRTIRQENSFWSTESNNNLNEILTNMFMTEEAFGSDGCLRKFSNHINNFVANKNNSQSYVNTNMPRGGVAMEQIQTLFTPAFQGAHGSNESQHLEGNNILAEGGQEDLEYITHGETQHIPQRVRRNPGPSPEEWARWKPDIYSFYMNENYTLDVTRTKMAKKGFYAEEGMYKRRFKEWGWATYGHGRDSGNSGGEPSIGNIVRRSRGRGLDPSSTLNEENTQTNSSRGTTVGASTPPNVHSQFNSTASKNSLLGFSHSYPAEFTAIHINPTYLNTRIPTPMSNTEFDRLMKILLAKVEDLYISYPAQKKWKVEKQREVEEDIHDDLLVSIASSVRNYSSISPTVGYKGFKNALQMLEKVVGVGEGTDCGLFSLPAIWVSFVRLVRKGRSDWAKEFLFQAFKIAVRKFGRKHSFVQSLYYLDKVWMKEPGQVEEAVFSTYLSCIAHVKQLGAFNLTYLSLWGDYVVYLDGTSTDKTHKVVNDIRGVIKIWEQQEGPDGGPDGDYTLELLGLTLYVLQSAPTMRDEAEEVAKDLLGRIDQRRAKAGGKLDGDMFITWKDLIHTLGTFCLEKKNYLQAISYLGEFLKLETEDDRDTLALERIERCYLALGRDEDAKKVWQWRMNSSEILLQKTNKEPADEKVAKDHEEKEDINGGDSSEEEKNSEATMVDQTEEYNEENLAEDDVDENEDAEVEIQLVEEEIEGLKRRLTVLKQARNKRERL